MQGNEQPRANCVRGQKSKMANAPSQDKESVSMLFSVFAGIYSLNDLDPNSMLDVRSAPEMPTQTICRALIAEQIQQRAKWRVPCAWPSGQARTCEATLSLRFVCKTINMSKSPHCAW